MKYAFEEIFSIPTITRICESFTQLENCVTALLDLDGKVHVATGWQDICTKFHRVEARTCARCLESDTALAGQLANGEKYNLYRCKNGLIDVAVPVFIEGEHVANFFTGQFFDRQPDKTFFKKQANEFGFDEDEYLEALSRVPIHDENRVQEIMAFLVELTELIGQLGLERLKQLEAEDARARELERRVIERTKELEHAKTVAEDANKAKSKFLSSMSHELRTPLNAILGFGQILELDNERLSEDQGRSVSHIMEAGNHLLGLIEKVLDLTKIESGNVDLSLETIDTDTIVKDALTIAEPIAKKIGVTFVVDGVDGEALPCVKADDLRLRQIVLNLVSNAIKYNRPGGSVTLNRSVTRQGTLRFSVKDTGLGIPRNQHDAVFQPFNRLNAEASTTEGSGIGLTITRELVHMMGGEIGFTSKEGSGSTFWFELPLAADRGMQMEQSEAAEEQSLRTNVFANLPQCSILYIEDNEVNRMFLDALMRKSEKVTLHMETSAEDGITSAKELQPDLILMDIFLPRMDGFEALDVLRSAPETKDIPVVALSANAMKSDLTAAANAGFDGYITKPVKVEELVDTIASAISESPRSKTLVQLVNPESNSLHQQ